MPHNRFFLDQILNQNEEVELHGGEASHLAKVMRVRPGDSVELVNGKNQLALASVQNIGKESVRLLVTEVSSKAPSFPTILCQAIPRQNHLEAIIEKGTELGATAFWLFPGLKSERKTLSATHLNRLYLITLSAIKQCGRLDLPTILLKPPLSEWVGLPYPGYFGDLSPDAHPFFSIKKEKGISFFIGPESGFADDEKNLLRTTLKASGVRLHSNILRTETAACAALTLIEFL